MKSKHKHNIKISYIYIYIYISEVTRETNNSKSNLTRNYTSTESTATENCQTLRNAGIYYRSFLS